MNPINFEQDPTLGYPVIFGERPPGMTEAQHIQRQTVVGVILSEFKRRGSGMSQRTGNLLSAYLAGEIDTHELTDTANQLKRDVCGSVH